MRLKTALVSLLLICPCAYSYGQLRFSSVGGEQGYSAMRAVYEADLDNGWVLVPRYGYYRMSDKEVDEKGSTSRYGAQVRYELTDDWAALAQADWQPSAVGYRGVVYQLGTRWKPFYYWKGLKEPSVSFWAGQERSRSYVDVNGADLPDGPFRQVATTALGEIAVHAGPFDLQAAWQKVIKYKSHVPRNVTFSWAEIPYMTAVLQGYIKDCWAVRASYPARVISPYASWAYYHYDRRNQVAAAVSAGLLVKLWDAQITGGVEVFEPRREERKKTYFSLSVDVPM